MNQSKPTSVSSDCWCGCVMYYNLKNVVNSYHTYSKKYRTLIVRIQGSMENFKIRQAAKGTHENISDLYMMEREEAGGNSYLGSTFWERLTSRSRSST